MKADRPTITIMRLWWEECLKHLDDCEYEYCELYWRFVKFLKNNNIEVEGKVIVNG